MKKIRVLNRVEYAVADYASASDLIIEKALARESFGVFCMPVHGLVLACSQHPLAEAVHRADLIVPDGQPVRWLMNGFYGTHLKDRVYGPTLTLHVLEKANTLGMKIFLYGGSSDDTLMKFAAFIRKNYRNVDVCGLYREHLANEVTLLPEVIADTGAQIVLVGRGCPAQELWIAGSKDKVNAVMIGIGAAFSFHAGVVQQAPAWMQDRGLEWLFRLYREPGRLLKRYASTNLKFILLVMKEYIRVKILRQKSPVV